MAFFKLFSCSLREDALALLGEQTGPQEFEALQHRLVFQRDVFLVDSHRDPRRLKERTEHVDEVVQDDGAPDIVG
jgi:hypothetical protein